MASPNVIANLLKTQNAHGTDHYFQSTEIYTITKRTLNNLIENKLLADTSVVTM